MDSKYKLSGQMKKYRENTDFFTKYNDVETELRAEIMGYQMAKKAGVPVSEIEKIDEKEGCIVFKRMDWSRLDQMSSNCDNHKKDHLELVQLCSSYIAKLHQCYSIEGRVNYSLQRERLIRLQNDLCAFQDISSRTARKVMDQILDTLANYQSLQSRTTYIHGDFIHQNVFGAEGGSEIVVFDWENSRYSDPIYDLSTFLSFFMIIAVKSSFYTIEDVNQVERVLLDVYNERMSLSEFDMERYLFFKFLGHHCMYWYYLLILQKFSQKFNDGRIEHLFEGGLDAVEVKKLICDLREENFCFKQTSFENICLLLKRSKHNALDLFKFPVVQIF